MRQKTGLATGSSDPIGSEAAAFSDPRGSTVHGLDNDMRRDFFGDGGDATRNLKCLLDSTKAH